MPDIALEQFVKWACQRGFYRIWSRSFTEHIRDESRVDLRLNRVVKTQARMVDTRLSPI
jgi:hypothetical protein